MKGEKMVKRSSFGSMMRKRLSDITNLHSPRKSPAKGQENLSVIDDSSTKNYIEKLLQENAVMLKHVQERDKIIESTRVELQRLRVSLQKTQLQNWNLAQTNSQMLAEINVGKDRLKNLQHEIACKDALAKAKILELEEKAKMRCQTKGLQEEESKPEKATVDHPLQVDNNNENKVPKMKRGRPVRSQSMGPTTSQQAIDKDLADNKRRCLRRQSVRLKPAPHNKERQADLFEIDVNNIPMNQPIDGRLRKSNSEMSNDERCSSRALEPQRLSIGRPPRRAAEKVQSYKEVPLNVKMRRSQ